MASFYLFLWWLRPPHCPLVKEELPKTISLRHVRVGNGEFVFVSFTPFCRDRVAGSCFIGQRPGFGLFFFLWPVSRCAKSKGKVHERIKEDVGGGGWGLRGHKLRLDIEGVGSTRPLKFRIF